jgi:ubiquinone/menaquinone biosynthesis C-methylase UbiE
LALDVTQFKQTQRKIWSTGNFPEVATRIESASEDLVAAAGVRPGQDVLDGATGTGNAAILAARAGAKVTGLDLTPELFDAARRRMAAAGVEIELIEGDAEELPFADDSFDRVLSVFGVMFVPRHDVGAAELVRVCRPGGTIAVAAWTPEGAVGQMFRTLGSYMPPPPAEQKPPMLWGSEQYVRELFARSGAELEFERRMVNFADRSAEDAVAYNERMLGPMVMAKAALEPQGRWDALRAELIELYDRASEPVEGGMQVPSEYLLTIARLPE